MALTEQQISAIRRSWAELAANPGRASGLFYGRLFRTAPYTRALFRADMTAQGQKLMDTIGFVVDHLDDPAPLSTAAAALARRHVEYGVRAPDYAPVGDALLWTLEHMLGPRFDGPTRDAWTVAYDGISRAMILAAYPDAAAAARADGPQAPGARDAPGPR